MRDSMTLFPNIPDTPRVPVLYVLLVDDNATNRAIMKRFITKALHQYHIKPEEIEFNQAISAATAIETVERRMQDKKPHYDVIIMDINMSATIEKEGLIATKAIRTLESESANVKPAYIIRYSTERPEPNEIELREQGFDATLNKRATKQIEVDAALQLALADHKALTKNQFDDTTPRHSS